MGMVPLIRIERMTYCLQVRQCKACHDLESEGLPAAYKRITLRLNGFTGHTRPD